MRIASWVLVWLVLAVSTARANPISVTLDEKELSVAMRALVEQREEPTGLRAISNVPALGLRKGDIVRAFNGEATSRALSLWFADSSIVYLDVLRGTRSVTVRATIKQGAQEAELDREQLKDRLERLRKYGDAEVRQLTKRGSPSGVVLPLDFHPLMAGTIIRKIDGKPTGTLEQVLAALEGAILQPKIVFDVESLGQPFTVTLVLDAVVPARATGPKPAPVVAQFGTIKKVTDTSYEIPKALVDALRADPTTFVAGARVVPAVADGKPAGFKLYAIRPSSIYAALGLSNGDTIKRINGDDLTSIETAVAVYESLASAKKLTVELVRRGQPVTLSWTVK